MLRVEFCTFADQRGETVYVNPLLVSHFSSLTPNRIFTTIVFDKDNSVVVQGSPKEIAAALGIKVGG